MTELLPACLQCNSNFQDEPGSPMIPRITLGDGRWVCAQCVDACTRGIARWRARRAKEQEEVEKERERRAAEERWRAEHTALLGRPKPSSLLKNLNSSGQRICFRFSSSYKRSVRFSSECSRLVATLSL